MMKWKKLPKLGHEKWGRQMSMNKISLAIAGLMLSAAPVMAADAIMNEPMPTPPPVEAADWSGLWIGAGVGYGMSKSDASAEYGAGIFAYEGEDLATALEWAADDAEFGIFEDLYALATGEVDADGMGGEGVSFRLGGGYDFQLSDRFVAGVFGEVTVS